MQQALAAMQGRPKPSLPMPSKRTSVMARSPDRERRDSGESSSDEDSVVTEESPGAGGPTGKYLFHYTLFRCYTRIGTSETNINELIIIFVESFCFCQESFFFE